MSNNPCQMCGWAYATNQRWYKYDNGEQFKALICNSCADLHSKLVNK